VLSIVEVEIREALVGDLPHILSLYSQPEMDDGMVLPLEQAEGILNRIKSYPDYNVYAAVYKQEIVGTFALLIMDNLAHMGAPSGIVEDVAVKRGMQGMGIGRQMMGFAMNVCRGKGCYKLVLSSNMKREKAHLFYEKLGFEKHGYSYWVGLKEQR
jgi:GNAT superfamily N-acetyltransferase